MDTTLVVVACQRLSCEAIPIRDDLEVENEKSFEVTLERTSDLDSRITIHPTRAKVIITDDDGMFHRAP